MVPRPTTKTELLSAANASFEKLTKLWDKLTPQRARALFPAALLEREPEAHWKRDQCLRDVVIHLHEWHNLVHAWVSTNQAGTEADFFPEPYTWRNYAGLNVEFVKQHQATSYQQARDLLAASHSQVVELIDTFTNEELFTKRHFSWTGTTSLGSDFISSTSSHYEWAAKKTRAYARLLNN